MLPAPSADQPVTTWPPRGASTVCETHLDLVDEAVPGLVDGLHQRLGEGFPRPAYDGSYVTWDDLARSPYECPDVPCILAGDFRALGPEALAAQVPECCETVVRTGLAIPV